MATILRVFNELGIPVSDTPGKVVGPASGLTLLGIYLDSNAMEMSLPADKLAALRTALVEWGCRLTCSKRQLLSLIGSLSFAAKVVPPGRTFLRRLIDLSTTTQHLSSTLHLTSAARADITWWQTYLPGWNGRCLIPDLTWTKSPEFQLFTDASGLLGFGIYYQGHWLNGRWTSEQSAMSLTWKELFPIALACRVWGNEWTRRKLLVHCDNASVVSVMASGTARDPFVMHLVRDIFFTAAKGQFIIFVQHIFGVDNGLADSLSRLQEDRFRKLAPSADKQPTLPAQPEGWWAP